MADFRMSSIFLSCLLLSLAVYQSFIPVSYAKEDSKGTGAQVVLSIAAHATQNGSLKIVRAGEEDQDTTLPASSTTEGPGTGNGTESVDGRQCDTEKGCCLQYTWPGPQHDNGLFEFSCAAFLRANGESQPCYEPVVFTIVDKNHGNRPNVTALQKHCDERKCNVYCPKTSCVKYSYTRQTGGGQLWNETRFCGTVLRDGKVMNNGCFQEKLDGFTKEVCVCTEDGCNAGNSVLAVSAIVGIGVLLTMFYT